MFLYRVLCKRTMKYLYYREVPTPFMNNNDFFITKVPSTKIKSTFIVSNTPSQGRFIPKDMFA